MKIFDTHAHYDDHAFDADRDALLSSFPSKSVAFAANMGCDLESSQKAVELAERYDFIYAAVGIHPENADGFNDDTIDALRALADNKKVVAIGEIGLDYHYPEPPRDVQIEVFCAQLALARELGLPVCVHERDAHGPCLDILKQYPDVHGVLHCYSGAKEMALELVKAGWYIGFTGMVSFKNAKKARCVAGAVPLDRILIETDCPYMAPEPLRGKRSDSTMLVHTAAAIAAARGTDTDSILNASYENACRFYHIKI